MNQSSSNNLSEIFLQKQMILNSAAEDLVGMDSRRDKVIEMLGFGQDDFRVVGIWGMDGIGKTTIAEAVYRRISKQFESCSFIGDIREDSDKKGLKSLQELLIYEILGKKDLKVGSTFSGKEIIRNKVCRKHVLIVLDDVDSQMQLEKLVGKLDCFRYGSRIIITTRDKHILTAYGVEPEHIYKVEELHKDEFIKLLSWHAFGKNQEQMGSYGELLIRAVEYVKGVPLALKVLGRFLRRRCKSEWGSALDRLKENPLREVAQVLRMSYGSLNAQEKGIFLDIACFFKREDNNGVIKILDGCGFSAEIGISVLVEKSLITISDNKLLMHDLIQDFGKNIVREKSPEELGERTRIWLHKDMADVLTNDMGTKAVQGIAVEYPCEGDEDPKDPGYKQLELSPQAFAEMKNLRILRICCVQLPEYLEYLSSKLSYLNWRKCPLKRMPSTFPPNNLVELHMTYSRIEQLWNGPMDLGNLSVINLSHSKDLIVSPDFTKVPNLERLILEGCTGLECLHRSIGDLRKLIHLNLKDCKNLENLPSGMQLKSLKILIASGCPKLQNILENFGPMTYLSELHLDETGIRELPQTVADHTNLVLINLRDCKHLRSIPNSLHQLKALRTLILNGCLQVDKLPEEMGVLESLRELDLSFCNLESIPKAICSLYLLERLNLRGNRFVSLPACMSQLSKLSWLSLDHCENLQELPELSSETKDIIASNCISLRNILRPSLYQNIGTFDFTKCFKLVENKNSSVLATTFLSNQFEGKSQREREFGIVYPGSEILSWFAHKSTKSLVSLRLSRGWYSTRLLGIAFSVVGFQDTISDFGIQMWFGRGSTRQYLLLLHMLDIHNDATESYHVCIAYVPRWYLGYKLDMNQLNDGGIEIEACFGSLYSSNWDWKEDMARDWLWSWKSGDKLDELVMFEQVNVKACGVRFVYQGDDDYIMWEMRRIVSSVLDKKF